MRVAIINRFPKVDWLSWKRELIQSLISNGHEVAIFYSQSGVTDHLRAGLDEFGWSLFSRYFSFKGKSGADDESGAGSGPDTGSSSGEAVRLADWAKERGIKVGFYRKMTDEACLRDMKEFAPDLGILAGADIIRKSLLDIPKLGVLNPHYALLPKQRGMDAAEWSAFMTDPIGVTIHYVEPGVDTGPIIYSEVIPVEPGDTFDTVREKQRQASARLLAKAVEEIAAGTITAVPQDMEAGKQYFRMHPLLFEMARKRLSGSARSN